MASFLFDDEEDEVLSSTSHAPPPAAAVSDPSRFFGSFGDEDEETDEGSDAQGFFGIAATINKTIPQPQQPPPLLPSSSSQLPSTQQRESSFTSPRRPPITPSSHHPPARNSDPPMDQSQQPRRGNHRSTLGSPRSTTPARRSPASHNTSNSAGGSMGLNPYSSPRKPSPEEGSTKAMVRKPPAHWTSRQQNNTASSSLIDNYTEPVHQHLPLLSSISRNELDGEIVEDSSLHDSEARLMSVLTSPSHEIPPVGSKRLERGSSFNSDPDEPSKRPRFNLFDGDQDDADLDPDQSSQGTGENGTKKKKPRVNFDPKSKQPLAACLPTSSQFQSMANRSSLSSGDQRVRRRIPGPAGLLDPSSHNLPGEDPAEDDDDEDQSDDSQSSKPKDVTPNKPVIVVTRERAVKEESPESDSTFFEDFFKGPWLEMLHIANLPPFSSSSSSSSSFFLFSLFLIIKKTTLQPIGRCSCSTVSRRSRVLRVASQGQSR